MGVTRQCPVTRITCRRNLRTRAPAKTTSSSRFRFTVTSQRAVRSHAIALTAPFDAAAEKARQKYDKRQHIANGSKPKIARRDTPTIAEWEQAIQFDLQRETAGQRCSNDRCGRRQPAKNQT